VCSVDVQCKATHGYNIESAAVHQARKMRHDESSQIKERLLRSKPCLTKKSFVLCFEDSWKIRGPDLWFVA
jgi:hypothetical protein